MPLDGPLLITGASGFIGSHLARSLVASGLEVHVLRRQDSSWRRLAEIRTRIRAWTADLRDAASIENVCAAVGPRYVFHLAGTTDVRFVDRTLAGVRESVDVNVLGSLNLVLALSRRASVVRLVRVGGLEEYGRGPAPYVETQRECPISPYSASQVAVTHYLQMLQPVLPFEAVTLRLALTYGPAQSERFLVPALIRHCLEGRDFELTSGEQRRDFIYIDDAIDAMRRAAVTDGVGAEVLNIGSGQGYRIADVARRIVALCGSTTRLRIGAEAARTTEIQNLVCDSRRAQQLLGWQPATDLESGLTRTIAWTRQAASQ